MNDIAVKDLASLARSGRHRLFEEVLNLDYDDLPYVGHLITKIAIENGYTEKRKNLKGNTIAEWSRSLSVDGKGAPNRWACLAATDLLVSHKFVPDADDVEMWATLIFHWDLAHGPFPDLRGAVQSVCDRLESTIDVYFLITQYF